MENTNKSYFFHTDQLTVGYEGKPLIREINIQLNKGEILTLIGSVTVPANLLSSKVLPDSWQPSAVLSIWNSSKWPACPTKRYPESWL